MGILTKVFAFISAIVVLLALVAQLYPVLEFPEEKVDQMVSDYYGSDKSCPMCGRIAIVTGSTSGLGESIAHQMYKV